MAKYELHTEYTMYINEVTIPRQNCIQYVNTFIVIIIENLESLTFNETSSTPSSRKLEHVEQNTNL